MLLLRQVILSSAVLISSAGKGQGDDFFPVRSNPGFRAGLVLALGTHYQRLGFEANFYYVKGPWQANTALRIYYNFKSPGPPLRYPELMLSQGVLFAYGKTRTQNNPFISGVSNQTKVENCIAYAYQAWFNNVKTTQQTGVLHLGFGPVSCLIENDILARPALDRFRSGSALLSYRHEALFETAITFVTWTGQYGRKKTIENIPAFYNNCYMDTTGGIYTAYSNGLLALQVKYALPFAQTAQASAGIDAEQIRDFVQNRVMHNLRFIPQRWLLKKNCHLPMVAADGGPYLYKKEQNIRKARPFLNLFTNAGLFY